MQIIEIDDPDKKSEDSQEKQDIVVGIDFGTTNSLIALSTDFNIDFLPIEGKEIIASVINIDKDGNISIAKEIKEDREEYIQIKSIKRLLGKSSKDISKSNDKQLRIIAKYLDLTDNLPNIKIGNKKYSLPELAAEIFKYLKLNAEKYLGKDLKKAVISVPAYLDDAAKGQISLAAKIAGFEVLRLIAEPTAAAYAYGLDKNANGTYMIYDLGGGTFDVSVLDMEKGIFRVIATGGDNMLGGDDIDNMLSSYLESEFSVDSDQSILLARIVKEKLSNIDVFSEEKVTVRKEDFEKLIEPLIDKTINIVSNVLFDLEGVSLDGIILVGGSTKIPLIKEKLLQKFKVSILDNLDPDKIVASGAAMQAENLTTKKDKSLLIDVVPLSLGVELYAGIVEKIILRNTPIPFSISKEFTTQVDNQTGIKFHIVQGERELANDCRSLAHFELVGIAPMKAGKARIEVNFTIDVNGILSVTAKDKASNNLHTVNIKPSYNLDEEEINNILVEAYKNVQQDHDRRLLLETCADAESLIDGINKAMYETPDILNRNEENEILNAIGSLKSELGIPNNRDNILSKMRILNKLAASFIQKHLDKGVELHLKGRNISEIVKEK